MSLGLTLVLLVFTALAMFGAGFVWARYTQCQAKLVELQYSADELTTIYDSALVGLVLFDEEGRYVRANRTYCDIYGYKPEELYGATFLKILPLESHAIAMQLHKEFIAGKSMGVNEWQVRRKDGALIWVNVEHSLIVRDDGRRFRVGVFLDITRRKESEVALDTHAQALEQRNQDLDAFGQMVAHDLKNPLGVIIGYTALMLEDYANQGDERLLNDLRLIEASSEKMVEIIDNLLLLAALREEQVPQQPLDMSAVLASVQQRLTPELDAAGATLVLPEQWPLVVGYAPWIEQVWFNYLSNALKYGGQPPRIELGVTPYDEGQRMIFWVRDNGAGLTPEQQGVLFVPFSRIGNQDIEGHGLGLSIVKRIIDNLGGEVGVESTPGQGSTFSFTLPVLQDVQADKA